MFLSSDNCSGCIAQHEAIRFFILSFYLFNLANITDFQAHLVPIEFVQRSVPSIRIDNSLGTENSRADPRYDQNLRETKAMAATGDQVPFHRDRAARCVRSLVRQRIDNDDVQETTTGDRQQQLLPQRRVHVLHDQQPAHEQA